MKIETFAAKLVLTAVALMPLSALAQSPTFDCKKVKGEVEKLICSDSALATLDQKLEAAYKAASAKAKGTLITQLRSEQRGWVKGRNDCWKVNGQQTWITATWTVDTIKGCVDAQYRLRTSELQSVWQLLPPKTVAYACQNNPANELVANFYETDPATIRLERGDRTMTMWSVDAATDGKYEGQNISLVQNDGEVRVTHLDAITGKNEELQCSSK